MKDNKSYTWHGRFAERVSDRMARYSASVDFDCRLAEDDIRASLVHSQMLVRQRVITAEEGASIAAGLDQILAEVQQGTFCWKMELEDVHFNIERRLIELVGEVGKKLHTARSRNDQVAVDVRLYLRAALDRILNQIIRAQQGLVDLAQCHAALPMPGLTHLQIAQPITFGHHMLAYYHMLERDRSRLLDCRKRMNVSPLGCAALAGSPYPVDREFVARELGFSGVCRNSIDAVSDRDFMIEFVSAGSLLMTHLSRFAEEGIFWMNPCVGFIRLSDRFCTGSSIMPQKKNPDVLELIRGKAARVNGALVSLLTLMKAQPLAYNRDNQEDKEPLFDVIDTLEDSLAIFADLVPEIEVNAEQMLQALKKGFVLATDLADYLVSKGIAFREAHQIVGRVVAHAEQQGCDLADLDLAQLRTFSVQIEQDVFSVLSIQSALESRNHVGATAPQQVRLEVERLRKAMQDA